MRMSTRRLASFFLYLMPQLLSCVSSEKPVSAQIEESFPPAAPKEESSLSEELVQDPDDEAESDPDDLQVENPGEIDEALASAEKTPAEGAVAADAVISDELKNAEIPIEINALVQQWIGYFTGKDRERFQRFLERGEKFKPMIVAALKDQGIPTELYYQAMIESGFAIHATSSAKAVGIWQFIKGTGRRYGLRIDRYVDERKDPIRSTVAAALYLKDLHNVFQSWYLALASYNAGEGRILNAIMRGKSRDFWELAREKVLPAETMHYIPKFLAATIIAHNLKHYGMDELAPVNPPQIVSVPLPSPVRLADIAEVAGVSVEKVRELNPHLLRGITPPGVSTYRVWVPKDAAPRLEGVVERLAANKVKGLAIPQAEIADAPGKTHKVARGESLAQVARRYGVGLRELKRFNGLRTSRVRAGTRLRIPTQVAKDSSGEVLSYKVRRGDNLDKVARRFGISVGELKRLNGLRRNRLDVGQVLSLKGEKS